MGCEKRPVKVVELTDFKCTIPRVCSLERVVVKPGAAVVGQVLIERMADTPIKQWPGNINVLSKLTVDSRYKE